jgi:murein L,D-transpeptidase YafK
VLDPGAKSGLILVVDKTRQELQIWRHDGKGGVALERVIPCSTGIVRGDKLVRGDMKTPDGFYVFNKKLLPHELPDIYGILAYPMDYPNFWDRVQDHGGSGIWTHGVNKPLVDYDSNGCVELFNHDIAGLEDRIVLYDTPILNYEEMSYAPADRLREEAGKVAAFVEEWRSAWAGKDHDRYASLYDRGFRSSDGMTLPGWLSHKRNVAAGYRNIRIAVNGLRIFRHRDVVAVSFVQLYDGDGRYSSAGYKRLYLKPSGGGYLIAAEDFEGDLAPEPGKRLDPERKREALTRPPLAVASFSNPVAAAGAGAILPGMTIPIVTASLRQPDDTQGELERSALEARHAGQVQGAAPEGPSQGAEDGPETPAVQAAPEAGPSVPAAPEAPILTASLDREGAAPGAASGTADVSLPAAASPSPPDGPGGGPLPAGGGTRNPRVSGSLAPPSPETPGPAELLVADASDLAPVAQASGGNLPGPPGTADIMRLDGAGTPPADPAPPPATAPAAVGAGEPAPPAPGPGPVSDPDDGPGPAPPPPATAPVAPPAVEAPAPAAGPEDDGEAINGLLAGWVGAWEEKDLERYFGYYAEDFRFPDRGMDREAFVKYRTNLIERAGAIDVELEGPSVKLDGGRATVAFVQRYSSGNYSDAGEKILKLEKKGGAWQIVRETFRAARGRG